MDLTGKIKAGGIQEYGRLPFVLEAKGAAQAEFQRGAQSNFQNAQLKADEASFKLFAALLQNDQALFRKNALACQTQKDNSRLNYFVHVNLHVVTHVKLV